MGGGGGGGGGVDLFNFLIMANAEIGNLFKQSLQCKVHGFCELESIFC